MKPIEHSARKESTKSAWNPEEAVAKRFSLQWNAVTSPWGLAGDLLLAFACAAVAGFFLVLAAHFHLTALAWVLGAVGVAPLLTCIVVNVALLGARSQVVAWLADQPFPVENLNALMAGFGEEFEIYFQDKAPSRDDVMKYLAEVSEDVFVLEVHEDQKMMRARLGVIVSKHNPYRQARLRYARFKEVVTRSLLPLHSRHRIARVLVA